nr:uncharacterized protein LOC129385652 isoform X1 [Dermacentor andersoni]
MGHAMQYFRRLCDPSAVLLTYYYFPYVVSDAGQDTEADFGGEGGGRTSGSGPSVEVGGTGGSRSSVPNRKPGDVLVPPPVSIVLVTPRPKPSPAELICTVGSFAIFPYMFPPDDLCNYVFYTNVVVVKNSLHGVETDASWNQFKTYMKTYTMTQAGISFETRYLDPNTLNDHNVQQELTNLAADNIKHYGFLKVLARLNKLDGYMSIVVRALEKLKMTQGADTSRRLVLAIGFYDYAEPNAWERYRSVIQEAVEQTAADTVIAISSTGWIENQQKCFSAPTSVFDNKRLTDPQRTAAKSYPDINTHADLVNFMYTKKKTRLGLSLEMGTLVYVLSGNVTDIDKRVYQPCKNFYLAQSDAVDCQGPTTSMLLPGGMRIGSLNTDDSILFSWEDDESFKDKLEALKTSGKFREGWSWLLYNVHLVDFTGKCSVDPFVRVQFFKQRLA